jgi:pyruvate dehydrogenase E2 component (dihydrolipoamide acetyltransferase)
MPFEFRLPDIGEGVAEGEIVQWFVKEGETIREDAPLVSVLTDKANVEIPSPKAGRVLQLHAQVGEKVKVGGLLVTIEPTQAGASVPAGTSAPAPPAASASKSTAPPPPVPPAGAAAVPPAPSTGGSVAPGPVLATPYLRRLAAERGIDLARVRGSGPGGRIVEADLLAPAAPSVAPPKAPEPSRSPAAGAPAVPPPAPAAPRPSPPDGDVQRIPIRGLRRVIADHMAASVHTAAHFTYVEEIDVSELVRLRERMAKHVEKQGVRLSYLPFLVKAIVAGLRAHPRLNATVDDARNELVVYPSYHIGIATATPDGLIVPVLHHAERKSLLELAREIQDLGERGRAGKLTRAELTGGTFTITSLGALGGVLATPILNYPEVGILGVHRIVRRPVYRADGSIGPADLMNLSISLDHRLIDGIEGAQFLATVKGYLEDPHQLFAEMA